MVRIQDVIGQVLTIHVAYDGADADIAGVSGLALGYEDDDYGDNGYYDHDNGNDDQCKDIGPAWVIMTIEHPGFPVY
jgi:hypothetical protein